MSFFHFRPGEMHRCYQLVPLHAGLMKIELESVPSHFMIARGLIDWPDSDPEQGRGRVVTLTGDAVPGRGAGYLCLVATHSYTSDNYGSGGTQGDDLAYRGHYVLMPDTAPMLPERKTPLADVRGPQTAVVVGEGEIDCDEYGRILVRFHWDLDGAYSMRCRVSQSWAGNGWGGMVIPRIGMEVVVEFLDGDPDQSLVTGCVYNGRNKVPYELPANKTRSTFKTKTHKGGGFNELRFEDERGREEIFLRAERDRVFFTQLNAMEHIGGSERRAVGRNRHTDIGRTESRVVGGDLRLTVGSGAANASILQSWSIAQLKSQGETTPISLARALGDELARPKPPAGNMRIFVVGSRISAVGRDELLQVKGNRTVLVDGAQSEIVHGTDETYVTQHRLQKTKGITSIVSDEKFIVECGKGRIEMTPDGCIRLIGSRILINGSEHVGVVSTKIDLN